MPLVPGRIGAVATHDDGTPELVRSRVAPVGTAFHLGEVLAISPTQPVQGQSEILVGDVAGERRRSRSRSMDAFNRGDRNAWLATRHEESAIVPLSTWPNARRIHGRGGLAGTSTTTSPTHFPCRFPISNSLTPGPTRFWSTSARDTDRQAAWTSTTTRGSSSLFAMRECSETSGSPTVPRPSKPLGCRSK